MPKDPASDPFAYTPIAELEPPTLLEEGVLWLAAHRRIAAVAVPLGILLFCIVAEAVLP